MVYEVLRSDGEVMRIDNPSKLPPPIDIAEYREPIITASILVPQDYVGAVIKLCIERRGVQRRLTYGGSHVQLVYELPMSEVVMDFFDRLKSVSPGRSLDRGSVRGQRGRQGVPDLGGPPPRDERFALR